MGLSRTDDFFGGAFVHLATWLSTWGQVHLGLPVSCCNYNAKMMKIQSRLVSPPMYRAIVGLFSLRSPALCGVAFCLTMLSSAAFAETRDPNVPRQSVKLLHVGNSFSWNATSYLPQLAKAGGKEITIFASSLGGCSLERHARHLGQARAGEPEGSPYAAKKTLGLSDKNKKNVSLPESLQAQPWDFVTIQQVSRQSFLPESYEPYAGQLVEAIREFAPQATILVHQTWTYREDHPLLAREKMTPQQMHERLSAAYRELGERYGFQFLPSGNAVYKASQTADWSYSPDPDFDYGNPTEGTNPKEKGLYPGYRWLKNKENQQRLALDPSHLNEAGKYLTGCVWYEILFQDSVLDVDYTPNALTPEQAADLRRIAHETVAEYRREGL